jgi:putative ribosome biogenesis GTPase RsgA
MAVPTPTAPAAVAAAAAAKIPVTVLTGFLGSGKTTFVNHVLREHHGLRVAVVENEFGEVGIDDGLVLQTNEEVIEMMNGCICMSPGSPSLQLGTPGTHEVRYLTCRPCRLHSPGRPDSGADPTGHRAAPHV